MPMAEWYTRNDQDWLSEHPDPMHDDESENEVRISEWDGDIDWGELHLIQICLECGNALTGFWFGIRDCEVC